MRLAALCLVGLVVCTAAHGWRQADVTYPQRTVSCREAASEGQALTGRCRAWLSAWRRAHGVPDALYVPIRWS